MPCVSLDAEPRRGHRGERGERLVGREAARHGGAQVREELVERREAVGGDGERDAGRGELRRVGGRQVPVPQVAPASRSSAASGLETFGRIGEGERHDERLRAALEHVDQAVLLAAAAEPRRELVLLRELVGAEVLLLARRSRRGPAAGPSRPCRAPASASLVSGGSSGAAAGLVARPRRGCTTPRP